MNAITDSIIKEAVSQFKFEGNFAGALPFGSGHINDTFAAYFQLPDGRSKRYILQRINTNVFKNPDELMENISGVTTYVRNAIILAGGDPLRETLNLIPAADGRSYYRDSEDGCWRAYIFIENATTFQQVKDPRDFYNSARTFGRFQQLLADYPAGTLHETIPNFHNTVERVRQFREAVLKDVCGRAEHVQKEIEFVLAREEETHRLMDLQKAGRLPLRVTHNDTKINNVMIDNETGRGICVIDLDTVMPGLSLYDYGDSIRFGATYAAEDEADLSKVWFDIGLFEEYTRGYLEVAGKVLTPCEIENMPMGAKLMTLECGIRFLTDYLLGDTYFKIHRPDHNLDRCRTQFKLTADMEEKWNQMVQAVMKHACCIR
jgi:hypothetical protein